MVSETYRDVVIVLLEDSNKWQFEVNGKERTSNTLPNAREAIDKAFKEEKRFQPFEALLVYGGDTRGRLVTITSRTQHYGREAYWISNNGGRSKENASCLFTNNEHNQNVLAELAQLQEQSQSLSNQIDAKRKELQQVEAPEAL